MTNKRSDISEIIEIWKKVVEVQKHFNEICLKIRSLSITIMTAFIGATGYLWTNDKVY